MHLFKVQFNNIVSIIRNILGAGHRYIFILECNSTITCKQQFDWIIKMGCDLIGRKIDYLNTIMFKMLCLKKRWTGKGKLCLAWSIYTFPVLHTHNKMFVFLANDKPVVKIVGYGINFLVHTFWKSIEVFSIFLSRFWRQSVRKKFGKSTAYSCRTNIFT